MKAVVAVGFSALPCHFCTVLMDAVSAFGQHRIGPAGHVTDWWGTEVGSVRVGELLTVAAELLE